MVARADDSLSGPVSSEASNHARQFRGSAYIAVTAKSRGSGREVRVRHQTHTSKSGMESLGIRQQPFRGIELIEQNRFIKQKTSDDEFMLFLEQLPAQPGEAGRHPEMTHAIAEQSSPEGLHPR